MYEQTDDEEEQPPDSDWLDGADRAEGDMCDE
jgi:hypothetical protein